MAEIKEEQEKKTSYKSLLIENIKYKTLLTKKYQGRKAYAPKDIKKVKAFIPGTISKIYVKQNGAGNGKTYGQLSSSNMHSQCAVKLHYCLLMHHYLSCIS